MSDDTNDLDAIEAAALGPDGTAYGDDTLALVAEVRRLRERVAELEAGIREHQDTAHRPEMLWHQAKADTLLWSLLDTPQAPRDEQEG